jgi:hypothetical protein
MRTLLLTGIILGPIFYAVVVVQIMTRTGFEISRQPLSLLSLGDAGWIQKSNFIFAGLLGLGLAAAIFGLDKGLSGIAAAILIAVFGAGIILAGVFPPDPSMGFPPGAPEGVPEAMSQSANLHGLGFMVSFSALTLAFLAFGFMFWADNRAIAIASFAMVIIIPVVIGAGMSRMDWASLAFFGAGALSFGWLSVVSYLLWKGN